MARKSDLELAIKEAKKEALSIKKSGVKSFGSAIRLEQVVSFLEGMAEHCFLFENNLTGFKVTIIKKGR